MLDVEEKNEIIDIYIYKFHMQVTCSPGYVTPLEPVRKPTCRENGIWSAPPPPCRSYKDV